MGWKQIPEKYRDFFCAISERDSADSLPSMASYLKGKKRVRRRASVPTKTKGKHKSTSCSLSLRYMVPNNTQHWDYHTFPDKNTSLSWKHLQNASWKLRIVKWNNTFFFMHFKPHICLRTMTLLYGYLYCLNIYLI